MGEEQFFSAIAKAKELESEDNFSRAKLIYEMLREEDLSPEQLAVTNIGDATTSLRAGDSQSAFELLRNSSNHGCNPLISAVALNVAAQAAHNLGLYEDSIRLAKSALENVSGLGDEAIEERHEALARLIFAYVESGQLSEAVGLFPLIDNNAVEPELKKSLFLYKAFAEELIGDYPSALNTLESLSRALGVPSREIEFRRARNYYRTCLWDKARIHIERARKLPVDGGTSSQDVESLADVLRQVAK